MGCDCLHINDIRAYGYTGYFPEEQSLGQWFKADLTIWRDLAVAGASDRLEDTLDYSQCVGQVQQMIRTQPFKLIESLAEAIAQSILAYGDVEQVRVQLTKMTPPIPDFSGQVVIDITRTAR